MEWEQERYDLKRQLSVEQALHKYLQEELELAQKELEVKKNNIEHLSNLLKEQKELNRQTALEWKTKLEILEKQKEEEEKKHVVSVDKLKEELSCVKIEHDKQNSCNFSDVQDLKNEKKIFEHDLETIKSEYQQLLLEKFQVINENKEIMEAKEEINNILLCKQGELTTYVERCTALQEEVILLKVENDAFKSAPPSHSKKGNSVFAEVDDNRKALKDNLDKLAEKYNVLKKDLKRKSLEISKLRAEKSSLLKKVQEICSKFENNESDWIETYRTRIKDLEVVIKNLKRENETRQDLSEEEKAINGLFAMKNEKIDSLQEEVEKLSQIVFFQNETIHTIKRDLLLETNKTAFELSEKMRLQEELNIAKALIEN